MSSIQIVIIDVSASMDEEFSGSSEVTLARKTVHTTKFAAALEFLWFTLQKLPPESELFIISFDETAKLVYHGSRDNVIDIEAAVSNLTATGRSTNLAAAFEAAITLLESSRHSLRVLNVVSDGLSNTGNPIPSARTLQREFGVFIRIYLIDPTENGLALAHDVVGRTGEGEVEPVTSQSTLRDRQSHHATIDQREYQRIAAAPMVYREGLMNFLTTSDAARERPRITAAYPLSLPSETWQTITVFIYTRELSTIVSREIEKIHIREVPDYGEASMEFPRGLPTGCPIRVVLNSNDELLINPPEATVLWLEPYNKLQFRIAGGAVGIPRTASIEVEVFAQDLPVASMRLSILITSDSIATDNRGTGEANWYEEIFASYAREDLSLVRHFKEVYAALGLYMFIDLEDLRSGALWRNALFEQIARSDLFQLFWSNAASESEYVEVEWRHALHVAAAKGHRFIRPISWEDPMPKVPNELSHINFRRI